jgi:UDP-glucose 4-epimerase
MIILITGAGGFLGKNILESIDCSRNEIIATSLKKDKLSGFLRNNRIANVKVHSLNVLNPNECASIIKNVEAVIHLAAIIDVGLSLQEPKKSIDANYSGTLNVLDAMRINKINKIIFPSTQDVYGNNINSREDEIDKISPLNPYSLSKLLCEKTIKLYSNLYDINYVIFRASNLYGKYQTRGLVHLMSERALKNSKVEMGNNVSRDFLNVNDFVNAIMMAIGYNKNGLFNIGTGSSTTLRELIQIIAEILDKKIEIAVNKSFVRGNKFERWREKANIENIEKLGWKPEHSLKFWLKGNLKNI